MAGEKISLKVITPTRVLYDGESTGFIVRTSGEVGQFMILPNHAPITADIGLGTVLIRNGEETRTATVMGGYTVVARNKAVIMAQAAEWPEEIDRDRAAQAKARAEERLLEENVDYRRAENALKRALIRLNLSDSVK